MKSIKFTKAIFLLLLTFCLGFIATSTIANSPSTAWAGTNSVTGDTSKPIVIDESAGIIQNPVDFQTPRVTILYFNDLHGHLAPFTIEKDGVEIEVGGIARIASIIKKIETENKAKNIKTLVLFAGDLLQGTPMSTVFNGWPDIECFNTMGVDAMTVGNHEFDFGLRNFFSLKGLARFPLVSSNIVWKDSKKTLCTPYVTFVITNDVSVSVIGVTTTDLMTSTKSSNVEKLEILDPVATTKQAYAQVKDKGPVILLSHSKHQTDRDIAAAIPNLAAIIGGHDQILLDPFRRVGDVPVFQAFEKGKYLGRLDLAIDPQTKKAIIESWTYIPITKEIKPDPDVERIVSQYQAELGEKFKEVIGEAKEFLDGERERIRYEETALGNFVADIMREYSGAQIALINAGSLRASIKKGKITVEDVFKMMPYDNEVVIVEITGAELMQALTRSVRGTREEEDGGFLHISGIKFSIRGKTIENAVIGTEPLNPDKTYTVAINDFMSTGGDGFEVFIGKKATRTGLPLRELIIDAIREKYAVESKIDGRILRVQ